MKKQNKMGAECDRSMMHVVPKGLGLFRELVKSIIRPIRTLDSTLALLRNRMHYFCWGWVWQRYVYDINSIQM